MEEVGQEEEAGQEVGAVGPAEAEEREAGQAGVRVEVGKAGRREVEERAVGDPVERAAGPRQ